jgi:hypothetical protein
MKPKKSNKMKKLMVIMLVFSFSGALAQKTDRIIKKNYEIVEAQVSKIGSKEIEYSFPGETLIYSVPISEIAKIEFANGRTQSFLESSGENEMSTNEGNRADPAKVYERAAMQENAIAVLPVPFIDSETLESSEDLAKFAQNDVYSKLIKKAEHLLPLRVQDLRETNNLLSNAGIDYRNVDEIRIEDLHQILGVDHIVAARVAYTVDISESTEETSQTSGKLEKEKVKLDESVYSSTSIDKSYNYTVYFDVYKDNAKIYTKRREPLLAVQDAWIYSMTWLLKRSPIYK